jgi:3-deoxy-D-manno-octulosonic-acid transferase
MRSLVLIEAEFWPNLLAEASSRGVSVGVAGARVSASSHARMSKLPGTVSRLLSGVKAFAAASSTDASRLCALGVPASRIAVCGWLKWPEASSVTSMETLCVGLQTQALPGRPLLVLGSVHPGEATELAPLLRGTPLAAGRAHWLLVARHDRHGAALRREATSLCPPETFNVDTRFGVLRSWYAHADAAYVGGGLFGRGCHDLLEPLAAGLRPLCHTRTGDPGSVAAALMERGLAVGIDLRWGSLPKASLHEFRVAAGAYDRLKADADGRGRTIDFFRSEGVLS